MTKELKAKTQCKAGSSLNLNPRAIATVQSEQVKRKEMQNGTCNSN
jgi:hypothetical protein